MNILFLLRLWPVYGGGETVTVCLANEMVRRGYNVHILYFKYNSRENLPFIDGRISSQLVEGVACDERYAAETDADKARAYLKKYINTHGITHVIDQWWPVSYIKDIREECGVKMYKCLHQSLFVPKFDANDFNAKIKRVLRPIYLRYKKSSVIKRTSDFFPHVDKYIFLSPAFQYQFEELAHYKNKGKLDSIPNPLVFERSITKEEFEKKENVVLIVARMYESQKRITAALYIWKAIEENPILLDWRLQIVGVGRDLEMYKSLSQELKLKRVTFEGFQYPVPYYIKSKIFLMTSYFEGFPMALIESIQMGVVPVVMDSFLSLHDIIQDGFNGYITPNADIESFVKKLESLMLCEEKRLMMAKNGIMSCKKFNVVDVVDQWVKLFNE